MRPAPLRVHPTFTGCLLVAFAGACTAPPASSDASLGFLHERIHDITDDPHGGTWIGFELSARSYRIDPELSPGATAMLAFARQTKAAGTPVHATFWDRDQLQKTPENLRNPGRPIILVRLADDPDPRPRR